MPLAQLEADFIGIVTGSVIGDFTITLADGSVFSNLDFQIGNESLPDFQDSVNNRAIRVTHSSGAFGIEDPADGHNQASASLSFLGLSQQQILAGGGIREFSFTNLEPSNGIAAFSLRGDALDDSDADGVFDHLDIDADNDGITDNLSLIHI